MKKKKILIAFADAGNGHRSASDALLNTITRHYKDLATVKAVDLFKLADVAPFNTSDSTHRLVSSNRSVESIYNFIYSIVNTSWGADLLEWFVVNRLYKRCSEIFEKESPDIVIVVHPMVNIIVGEIKKRGGNFKLYTVVTDLVSLTGGWMNSNSDLIFVPTEEAAKLCTEGVDAEKIIAPLFPLNPSMASYRTKSAVLAELKFRSPRPVVLVTGGGVGSAKLEQVVAELSSRHSYNLIVICGRLEALREELAEDYKRSGSVRVLGFVDNMQDYLNACDVAIGKPGPATILELELFNKKALLTQPIGRQEWGNIDYALETENFIYIKDDYTNLAAKLAKLLKRQIPANPHARRFDEARLIMERILSGEQ